MAYKQTERDDDNDPDRRISDKDGVFLTIGCLIGGWFVAWLLWG